MLRPVSLPDKHVRKICVKLSVIRLGPLRKQVKDGQITLALCRAHQRRDFPDRSALLDNRHVTMTAGSEPTLEAWS